MELPDKWSDKVEVYWDEEKQIFVASDGIKTITLPKWLYRAVNFACLRTESRVRKQFDTILNNLIRRN